MNKGWECPKCGKVYAPHVDECKACNKALIGTGSTNDETITSATITSTDKIWIYHRKPDDPRPMWPMVYTPYRIQETAPKYPQRFTIE